MPERPTTYAPRNGRGASCVRLARAGAQSGARTAPPRNARAAGRGRAHARYARNRVPPHRAAGGRRDGAMPGANGQANAGGDAWRSCPKRRLHAGKHNSLCAMNMKNMTFHDISQQPGLFPEGMGRAGLGGGVDDAGAGAAAQGGVGSASFMARIVRQRRRRVFPFRPAPRAGRPRSPSTRAPP